jgi:hypothetical protein
MIAVLAGSKKQYDDFLRPWLDYKDKDKFRYVPRVIGAIGVNFTDYIRIGTFYTNPEYLEIIEAIERRIEMNRRLN